MHSASFVKNGIDGQCLKVGMDEQTLIGLGLSLPVHRKKVQDAAQLLFEPSLAPSASTSSLVSQKSVTGGMFA